MEPLFGAAHILAATPTRVSIFHLYVATHEREPRSADQAVVRKSALRALRGIALKHHSCPENTCFTVSKASLPVHAPDLFRIPPLGRHTINPDRFALSQGASLCLPSLPISP